MIHEQGVTRELYSRLLGLYPRGFRERLGESMQQTFNDLCEDRKRHPRRSHAIYVLWIFVETAAGALKERISQAKEMNLMTGILTNAGSAAIISFLLVLPLVSMEIVNRREFNEGFPITLFVALWLNLFALSLVLVPVVRNLRVGNRGALQPGPERGSAFLTNPKWTVILGLVLLLSPLLIHWLDSLAGAPLQNLMNGPNPDQPSDLPYIPGLLISLALFFLPPVAAAIIASRPLIGTLRAGGSLFAHPFNLIIVALVVAPMIYGLTTLIIDQWPCFMGVPNCD